MSVNNIDHFTKDWNNSTDFPSVEPSETNARRDMQYLHDEMLGYLNTLITDHNDNIPAPLTNAEIDEATQ